MTTIFNKEKKCFVCGETNEYRDIGSTNRFGSADLDTRPPEMMRSTIYLQINCCPSCGYCAPEIAEGPEIAVQIIKSGLYLQQLENEEYPELARKFLCSAIVLEASGEYNVAGWAAVRAAWACDDAQMNTSASKSRQRALKLFNQAQANEQSFGEGSGVEEAIVADLFRRIGDFDEVETVCRSGLEKGPEEVVEKILLFQQALVRRKDMKCHTIAEAVEFVDT